MADDSPSHWQSNNQDKMDTAPFLPTGHRMRFPQEVLDIVLDNVSDRHRDRIGAFRDLNTLRACALVAKAWRKRAQRRIFWCIELPDTTTLYRLVDILRASLHLAGYVQVLSLSRRAENAYMGYSPGCVEVLFPTVLGGLLPRLRCVVFDVRSEGDWAHVRVERDAEGHPAAIVQDTPCPFFPGLPLHPRFPLRLSAFSSLEELDLSFVVFQNFYDFARTLYHCKQLRSLHCGHVDWHNLGVVLPAFMTGGAPRRKGSFLPLLEHLSIVEIGEHGAERLLAGLTLTASLRRLIVTLSFAQMMRHGRESAEFLDPATGKRSGFDLSGLSHLADLTVHDVTPDSFGMTEPAMLPVLRDMLESWDAPVPRSLSLWIKPGQSSTSVNDEPSRKREFFAFLGKVGRTVEQACTCRPHSSTIPTIRVYLEIPGDDGKAFLAEVGREAVVRFPMASKAGKLRLDVYASDHGGISWESTISPAPDNTPSSSPRPDRSKLEHNS